MDIKRLDVAEALQSLNTSSAGLGAEEIARRRKEFGPNRIEAVRSDPIWLSLAREFTHFFALILWVAAALAFIAEAYEPGAGMRQLGWAIVGVIVVNGVFSFWQEYRAEKAVEALRNLLPQRVDVLRDGVETTVNAEELVPGDIVKLEEGNKVPADCRLIEASGLRANIATLTGESHAVARNAGPADTDDPLQARNLLLAGTLIVGGQCRAVVYATGMHTEFGKIAHLTQTVGETITPLQREITRLSQLVAMLATALGIIFFFIGQALALPFWDNFMFAIGIIVANVPEGLLPTVTLSLAMATQRMAKRNALVRHLARRRNAGFNHGDLFRQDGHPDAEPHDGSPDVCGQCAADRRYPDRRRYPQRVAGGRRILPQPEVSEWRRSAARRFDGNRLVSVCLEWPPGRYRRRARRGTAVRCRPQAHVGRH